MYGKTVLMAGLVLFAGKHYMDNFTEFGTSLPVMTV